MRNKKYEVVPPTTMYGNDLQCQKSIKDTKKSNSACLETWHKENIQNIRDIQETHRNKAKPLELCPQISL